MKILNKFALTALTVALLGCSAVCAAPSASDSSFQESLVTPSTTVISDSLIAKGAKKKALPAFSLKSSNGYAVSNYDYRNKVLIVDVWASWCPPCRKEIPELMDLSKRYGSQGLSVLGLSVDQSARKHNSAVSKLKISYPSCLASSDNNKFLSDLQTVVGKEINCIPFICVFDRKGILQYTHEGMVSGAELENVIKPFLSAR